MVEVAHASLSASLANAVNSCASDRPTVANAYAALLRPCALKSPTRRSASLAIAHAVLASSCGLKSQTRRSA